MSVKRSFSSERGGSIGGQEAPGTAHLPGFLQLLLSHRNQTGSRLRQWPKVSPVRATSISKSNLDKDPNVPTNGSIDTQSTRSRISHTHATDLLQSEYKRTPTVPRSSSVARRRPDFIEPREKLLGTNTPLRAAAVKPLDINLSMKRVQDLIRGVPASLVEGNERSPPRFRPPRTSLRRPFHTSSENKHKYLPARHVPVDSVPLTSRPPEVLFQPSACKSHAVDLKVLQDNSAGKLQRELELRRLAETIFADVKSSSILRKTHTKVRDDRENDQPRTVTFAEA